MKWTVTISHGFTFEEIQLITKPMAVITDSGNFERYQNATDTDFKEFVCLDCKYKMNKDETVEHPDYEEHMTDEWKHSCPLCLGEVKEIS